MIVVDASIALKWVLIHEEYYTNASFLLERHLAKKEEIWVPELLFTEVANTLVTKVSIPSFVVSRSLQKIFSLQLFIYHATDDDLLEATNLARKQRTTVYDMLYAIIAKRKHGTLVTADEQFLRKTRFSFAKHIKDIETH